MANKTMTKTTRGATEKRRKAFFLLGGQKTGLALGPEDDVAVPTHLRRGQASRPEWRKIWEHFKDMEHYEKQFWPPLQRRGKCTGLQAATSLTGLREKQNRWLCWRAASQWWVAGVKLEPLGAAQVAVARRMLASRLHGAVGGLSRQGNDSI